MKLDELWLKTRRGVLYALYLVGALLVQNVILSHVALFGVRAMFLPALVVAAALFEGGWGGGLFGLAAGILSDLFFGSQSVLFTVPALSSFTSMSPAPCSLISAFSARRLFTSMSPAP